MTSTHEAFRQISDLLDAQHEQAAWNLFKQVLREAHDAAYDEGRCDTEYDYTANQPTLPGGLTWPMA